MTIEGHARRGSGRPRTGRKPGQRSTLSLRVTTELYDRLDHAAKSKGDTLSREAEIRLEQSFRDEDRAPLFLDAVYGSKAAALLELLGNILRNASRSTARSLITDDFLSDPDAYGAVEAAILQALESLRPAGNASPDAIKKGRMIANAHLMELRTRPLPSGHGSDVQRINMAIGSKLGTKAAKRARDRAIAAQERELQQ
jgi:hypothetical protein